MRSYRHGNRTLTLGFAVVLGIVAAGAGWNARGGAQESPRPAAGGAPSIDPDAGRLSPGPIGGPAAPSTTTTSSGSLDTSFAGDGTIMTFIPPILEEPDYNTDIPVAVAIDGDGRILVAGYGATHPFVLVRYNADGTLDTTFGTDGLATFDTQAYGRASCMAVQPDGRILVGGGLGAYVALARFMPDGSLDPDFGQGGIVQQGEPRGSATNIDLLSDGRIILATGGVTGTLHLARYEFNGLPDDSFGTNGVVDTGLNASGIIDMAQQADGRFVFVWFAGSFTMARFNADGSADAGFGTGGLVDLPFWANAVVAQPDGKIVVGGWSAQLPEPPPPPPGGSTQADKASLSSKAGFEIGRYNPDGSLDESFGAQGLVTTNFNGQAWIYALALDAQGRLVAAGTFIKQSGGSDFALARYESDGRIDKTFGRKGKTTADVDGLHLDEGALAIAVQPDGRLVVVGPITLDREGPLDSFAWGLARFLP